MFAIHSLPAALRLSLTGKQAWFVRRTLPDEGTGEAARRSWHGGIFPFALSPFNTEIFHEPIIALIGWYGAILHVSGNFKGTALMGTHIRNLTEPRGEIFYAHLRIRRNLQKGINRFIL